MSPMGLDTKTDWLTDWLTDRPSIAMWLWLDLTFVQSSYEWLVAAEARKQEDSGKLEEYRGVQEVSLWAYKKCPLKTVCVL
jgi:hypothetical protein